MKKWKYWKRGLTVLGVATAALGVFLGLAQFREANRLQEESNQLRRAELDSHFEEVMMGLDRHFVAYPHLRPFFYSKDAKALPPAGPLRSQALGTAELIIDFADDIGAYARIHEMAPPSERRWTGMIRSYFVESPAVRFAWTSFHSAYDKSTACILGAPYRPQLLAWRWQFNTPSAHWPEVCD